MKQQKIVYLFTILGALLGGSLLFTFTPIATLSALGEMPLLVNLWEALAFPLVLTAMLSALLSEGAVGELQGGLSLTLLSLPLTYAALGYILAKGLQKKDQRMTLAVVGGYIGGIVAPQFALSPLFAGALPYSVLLLCVLPFFGALVGGWVGVQERSNHRKGL